MEFKYERVTPNEDLPFRMFLFEGKNGNYKVPKHWHGSIEIFLVLEGIVDVAINGVNYRLQRGQLVLVNSNEVHAIDATYKNFTIVLQIPRQLLLEHVLEDEVIFKRMIYKHDQELIAMIKKMYGQYELKKQGYRLEVLSYFYKLLYILVSEYKLKEIDEGLRRKHKQLEKLSVITHYIKEHYKEDISLESVAKEFGFNPTYLSKMFQKYAGINYKTYVVDVRMNKAYTALMNTEDSLTTIAMDHGFADSRSFAKAFKKRFGVLPSVYRKDIRKRQESAINVTSFW